MENQRHIFRRTKVLSKIDEKGYEQRKIVTEDINLITGGVKVVKIEPYDWEKDAGLWVMSPLAKGSEEAFRVLDEFTTRKPRRGA